MWRPRTLGHAATNLLTLAVKLIGLASAFNQLLLQPHPQSVALAVSAFMVGGAQLSETLILAVLDRLLGEHHDPGEITKPGPDQ